MNKDEMIEEMAKVLCDNYKRCEECISRLLLPCRYKSYCTKLYNAGYRKVADDEIVESMKTYERARQETAREILQRLWEERNALGQLMVLETDLTKLAKEYDIELG